MKTPTFILTAFLFVGLPSFGQTNCETSIPDSLKRFDSYSKKEFDRLKKKKNLTPETAFNVATYLRSKSDTSFLQWYQTYIDLHRKRSRWSNYPDKYGRPCMLFQIGQAYYFLDDYQRANSYFQKAIKAKCADSCVSYYSSQTAIQNYSDSIDWQTIIKDSNFTVIKNASELDPILLYKFPVWKTMANPGDNTFNPTDNGGGNRRRWYFAAKCGDYWVVSYEHGGRGYHDHCFFIKIKPHKTLLVFEQGSQVGKRIETFETLEKLKSYDLNSCQPIVQWDWYDY